MEKPVVEMRRLNVILLSMVIALSAIMISMNYYTIKLLSASRAYINGESQYSKGQKEASGHLIAYIYGLNPADYQSFKSDISIPVGDRIAREALMAENNHPLARKGFLQAKNHPDDIDDMIWLFDRFKNIGLFANAVTIWRDADVLIERLRVVGVSVNSNPKLSAQEKNDLVASVNDLTTKLTVQEAAFSDDLGIICRKVNVYVFTANVLIMLIIVIGAVLYTGRVIHNIEYGRKKIAVQNKHLSAVNNELDQLIYSVTHDLRSPLASLNGLVELIDMQTDIGEIKEFTKMMKISIDKQNAFINTILRSAEAQNKADDDKCDLELIIDDVIAQNLAALKGNEIRIDKELEVKNVVCDQTKLITILNNLISNAVKYADVSKGYRFIKIRSFTQSSNLMIEVEDNGIGISEQNSKHIFDKYFVAKKSKSSLGIGLYLVKNIAIQMNGEITITSKPGQGSTFTLTLPGVYSN
jgi:signal transduction histidine kinase